MNIDQIKYVLEVTKERSITRAARKLHLSPSAVSQSITQLERELGVTIFNRSRQGTVPTPEGKKIIHTGIDILGKLDELQNELSDTTAPVSLKIGCGPALTYVVYDAFVLFNQEFPHVNIEIIEMDQDEVWEAFSCKEIDLVFSPFTREELQKQTAHVPIGFERLYTGEVCVCVSKHSPLYHQNLLYPEDIRNEKIVIYNSKRAKSLNEQYTKNNPTLFTSNNIEVLKAAVLDGKAICIIYDFTFKNHPDVLNGNLAIIPLNKESVKGYDFWVMYPAKQPLSLEARDFHHKVRELIHR
ncbi:LysR family transcriptional regulator [Rossellomorea sp. y25]|uniref:LysR family transcriptional regulator n=1 Tax=Rossellomorea sp. y25 TaxID=3118174 RepID=UPI002627CFA2|nr:LysR family transcriptional regulator [uncultured Rossellomorea sp.]